MSVCLKCGMSLPPVGDCAACQGKEVQTAPRTPLLDRDLHIDRRQARREEAPATDGGSPAWAQPLAQGTFGAPAPRASPDGPRLPAAPPAPHAASAQLPPPPPRAPAPPPAPAAFAELEPVTDPFAPTDPSGAASPFAIPPALTLAPSAPVAPSGPGADAAPIASSAPPRSTAVRSAARPSTEVHARPASLPRRLAAWLVDGAALSSVAALYLLIAAGVSGAPPAQQGLGGLDALVTRAQSLQPLLLPGAVLLALLAVVYGSVTSLIWGGRTLGRLVTGIRLVDETGQPPPPGRLLLRAVLALFSFALFLSGFWLALFDRRGQTLHDKLTSTFVIRPS